MVKLDGAFGIPVSSFYKETDAIAQLIKNLPAGVDPGMQETWVQFLSLEDPLEKEMATHCNILAWRIPWTEEPGRLQSTGWQELDMTQDFPGGSQGKAFCLQCRRPGFNPWVGKILWRRKWQPTPALLPGKSHGWRSMVGYSPWGHKSWT